MEPANLQNKAPQNSETAVIIEERISKVNGDVAIRQYARGKMLGKGGFAKCYEVKNLETKHVQAAKIIAKASLTKPRARQKLISEIKIHKSLHHTNIVNFEHVFEDQESVYILLELCTNQTLNELLKRRKRLTELEAQCFIVQMISALKYLHSNRVIHRDLKLANLLLSEKMEIKICDFGLAGKLDSDSGKRLTICGTPNYIAPEILDGKIGHSYEVDVWSLGVICYTLLVGKPPFETPDAKTTYKKIKMGSYSFPDNVRLSDSAKELITRILNLDPARRPSLDEILQHPFINHGGTIPKLLPASTFVCPPSPSYLRQFLPQSSMTKSSVAIQKMTETTPINEDVNSKLSQNQQNNLISIQAAPLTKKDIDSNANANWNPTQTANNLNKNVLMKDSNSKFAMTAKDFKSTENINSSSNFQNMMGIEISSSQKHSKASEVWVIKWVDYSSKYELGYLLSNGAIGVFFNDPSKILLDPRGSVFEYMERRQSDKQDVASTYTQTEYPKELQKKVTLLQHFENYLDDGKNNAEINQYSDEELGKIGTVYVKKWMKTKHAIMFRLNNKIIQVNFTDSTEIILSSENKLITYVNKKGERSNYPLASALESTNAEMTKRLKYAKEILTQMLSNNTKTQVQSNPEGNHNNAGVGNPVAED